MGKTTHHKPIILIDTREQNPWKFNVCTTCAGSEKQGLKTGDYTIKGMEELFVIERKGSASEIYNNLGQAVGRERFYKEMERMKDFKWKFIFLDFGIEDIYKWPTQAKRLTGYKCRQTPQFIVSQLVEIQAKYGVPFIFLGNPANKNEQVYKKQFINRFIYKYYNLFMDGEI